MAGDFGIGLLCCSIAGIGFGTNFLPVKKLDVADGVFFSFCMSLGIIAVGVIITFLLPTEESGVDALPKFHPFAMLGGAAWMAGNLLCPLVIKWIGLGVGLTVWDLMNMLMGWATGRFGLFSIHQEPVHSYAMNYTGLALATASLFLFTQARDLPEETTAPDLKTSEPGASDLSHLSQVKVKELKKSESAASDLSMVSTSASTDAGDLSQGQTASNVVISDLESGTTYGSSQGDSKSQQSFKDAEAKIKQAEGQAKFVIGFLMAMLAGVFMGYTFTPAELLAQRPDGSHDQLDYVWSNFAGIVVTGNIALVGYVLVRGEKAHMPRGNVLPAIVSGAIWAIAQTAWFKANQELSMVIAFPIIASLPGIIALAIGVLFLGELQTKRARVYAGAGAAVRAAGIVLIALSNVQL
jgi:glucose uptake protein GlcU